MAMQGESMVVAGVMSGTSADGVEVAACRIGPGAEGLPVVEVLAHRSFPYPAAVREKVLHAMNAESISVAELSRLNWRLGSLFADGVAQTMDELGSRAELVGCHGQTVYHQATAEVYLGAPVRATWQTGEAAVIAERMRCSVVSDFRPADLAAGGQGAPLVPMLDFTLFRAKTVDRALVNLGGIANVTAMPAGCAAEQVLAFDTGPGNMVIDACVRRMYGRQFDDGGALAASGQVVRSEVDRVMRGTYFASAPPKSCGREQFGAEFCEQLIAGCRAAGASDADVVATATAVTVTSIVSAYEQFVMERMTATSNVEFVVAGGGVRNGTLMRWLGEELVLGRVTLRRLEELGVAAEAKEAVAFALLAWLTWWGLPGNVTSATGATRPAVLGKVCFA